MACAPTHAHVRIGTTRDERGGLEPEKMCSILFHCVPLSFGLWYTVGQWSKEIGQATWVCPIERL